MRGIALAIASAFGTSSAWPTLVIAQSEKRIRTVHGDPFFCRWMFLDDGKTIAIESGPLHFGMACMLIEIATGGSLTRVDCFH